MINQQSSASFSADDGQRTLLFQQQSGLSQEETDPTLSVAPLVNPLRLIESVCLILTGKQKTPEQTPDQQRRGRDCGKSPRG